MINPKNKIVMITWRDAAYSFEKEFPDHLPETQTAIGFVIDDNPEFIKISNNAYIEEKSGEVLPIDGFLISKRSILEIKTLNI